MGSIRARDAAALLGYDFLGLCGFSFWVLSSVENILWIFLVCFLVLLAYAYQARRRLDVLPAHAT
jgi:hypothetical protein